MGDGPDAVIFDLDGVITFTARVHAAAWKELFDDYLRARSERIGTPFRPFDAAADYYAYVDGRWPSASFVCSISWPTVTTWRVALSRA